MLRKRPFHFPERPDKDKDEPGKREKDRDHERPRTRSQVSSERAKAPTRRLDRQDLVEDEPTSEVPRSLQETTDLPGSVDLHREVDASVRTAPRSAAPPNDRLRLQRLLDINKAINAELELGRLLDMIMDAAIGLSNARRGFLVLWDKGEAKVVRARNFEKMAIDSPEAAISRHLVREAIDRRETVVTAEAAVERGGYASTTGLNLKSVLVSPLLSRGRVVGAIYLDEPDRIGVFTPEDVRTVEAFCDQAALALQNARALDEMQERMESQRLRLKRVEDQVRRRDVEEVRRFGNIVARSTTMRKVFELLHRVAETSFPVIIQGESGTGKELVAKAIHYSGPRKDGPFVATNCAAVPETLLDSELFGYVAGAFTGALRDRKGLFEQADKGTLFLDEIEEMSAGMQGKLLRVLQEGEVRRVGAKVTRRVDVRVLAATNRDIRGMVERGEFRRDLYYRLNVIPVTLPPLRERREDIPLIVEDLLARLDEQQGPKLALDPEAIEALQRYRWPGNVRELENELKRVLALGVRRVRLQDLTARIVHPSPEDSVAPHPQLSLGASGQSAPLNLRDLERLAIERALEAAGNNKTQAAKILGLSRRGLLKKLERLREAASAAESDEGEVETVDDSAHDES
jgi:transcriptional regulator with GAF, ATPase, and Fis domain